MVVCVLNFFSSYLPHGTDVSWFSKAQPAQIVGQLQMRLLWDQSHSFMTLCCTLCCGPALTATEAGARLCFTALILEECWLDVRRLAVLLLSDISLHLHSGSQEAESQSNHSTGCVIRMTNQSIFFLSVCNTKHTARWHRYGSLGQGVWLERDLFKERKSSAWVLAIIFFAFLSKKMCIWQSYFFITLTPVILTRVLEKHPPGYLVLWKFWDTVYYLHKWGQRNSCSFFLWQLVWQTWWVIVRLTFVFYITMMFQCTL